MATEKPVKVRIEGDIIAIIEDMGRTTEQFLEEALILAALDQGRLSIVDACKLLGLSPAGLADLMRSGAHADQRKTA